jgi:hypothetical protein
MSIHSYKKRGSLSVPNGTTVSLVNYWVPAKCHVTIRKGANYTDTITAWGSITWILQRNGIPVPPYQAMLDPLGNSQLLDEMEPVQFFGGDLLEVLAYNNSGGAVGMGFALQYDQEE